MHFFTLSVFPLLGRALDPAPTKRCTRSLPPLRARSEVNVRRAASRCCFRHSAYATCSTRPNASRHRRSRQRKTTTVLLKSRNQQELSPLQTALGSVTQHLQLMHIRISTQRNVLQFLSRTTCLGALLSSHFQIQALKTITCLIHEGISSYFYAFI